MPKTLPERIFFTIVMAAIMVYGMIVYNVALNTNGVTNATFCYGSARNADHGAGGLCAGIFCGGKAGH